MAHASVVSICNKGLGWVGGNRILTLDDGTTEANLCKDNYDSIRDALLEDFDWSFAIDREKFPAASEAPDFGFSKKFPIPHYALRVIEVTSGGKDIDYRVEANHILADEDAIEVVFIRQITDPNKLSPLFREALAARLAADFAIPLAKSRSLQEDLWRLFDAKLSEALNVDSMQGSQRKIKSTRLKNVR